MAVRVDRNYAAIKHADSDSPPRDVNTGSSMRELGGGGGGGEEDEVIVGERARGRKISFRYVVTELTFITCFSHIRKFYKAIYFLPGT